MQLPALEGGLSALSGWRSAEPVQSLGPTGCGGCSCTETWHEGSTRQNKGPPGSEHKALQTASLGKPLLEPGAFRLVVAVGVSSRDVV